LGILADRQGNVINAESVFGENVAALLAKEFPEAKDHGAGNLPLSMLTHGNPGGLCGLCRLIFRHGSHAGGRPI
jgi:hypothetical protein